MTPSAKTFLASVNQSYWTFAPFHGEPALLGNQSAVEHWTQKSQELQVDLLNVTTSLLSFYSRHAYPRYVNLCCEIIIRRTLIFMLCVFGFLGNFVTILVLRSDSDKQNTTIWLLQALTVADNIFLLLSLIELLIKVTVWDNVWQEVHTYYAAFASKLHRIDHTLIVCIVVLLTVDRYLGICKPMHVKWRNLRRVKLSLLCMFIVAVVLNTPCLISSISSLFMRKCSSTKDITHINRTDSSICLRPELLFKGIRVYCAVVYILVDLCGPFIVITILNVLLSSTLRDMKRKRRIMKLQMNREGTITKILAAIVVVFFICHLPDAVINIILIIDVDVDKNVIFCARNISYALVVLNSAINFLIYSLSSSRFKRIFYDMLPCHRRQRTNIVLIV